MKKRNILILGLFLFTTLFIFGCKKDTNKFTINYVVKATNYKASESFELGTTVKLKEYIQDGYVFLGWYDNEKYTGEKITEYRADSIEDVTFYGYALTNELNERRQNLQKVSDLCSEINKLSKDVSLDDYEKITELMSIYDSLYEEYKANVYNFSYLEEIFQKYQDLVDRLTYEAFVFDNKVLDLPLNITVDYKELVDELINEYESLSDDVKKFITKNELLNSHYEKIQEELNSVNTISYVLGKNIYKSKEDLYLDLFSELYYFLKDYSEEELFTKNNISSLDDFLKLGKNYNAGNGEMRGLANIFGWYFLKKDLNGATINQPYDKFIGYCYKHKKFNDFISFYQRFFAYWRIDEGYANVTNPGADMYAEGWASLVDLCKFFYFSSSTSPVKSTRVIDMFENIASVIKEDLPRAVLNKTVLPTTITLRGYKFLGWYDNPEFLGEPITEVTKTGKKIILYAKFEVDDDQVNKDLAALIEVYIDNLLTNVAVINDQTIAYVYNMYEKLDEAYRALVKNYAKLEELKNK